MKNIAKLPILYQFVDSEAKRNIVCSMFPEKLTFDGEQHGTLRVNEAIGVFDSVKAVIEQKKDRKTGAKSDLRSKVTVRPQFSNTFIEDLKKLAAITETI